MIRYALLENNMKWIGDEYSPTEEVDDAMLYETLDDIKMDLRNFNEPNKFFIVEVYITEHQSVIRDYKYKILDNEGDK